MLSPSPSSPLHANGRRSTLQPLKTRTPPPLNSDPNPNLTKTELSRAQLQGPGGGLAEYKYDGVRAQLHLLPSGGGVRIFSRNGEDRTAAFPDVAALLAAAAEGGCTQGVWDAEVAAIDRATGRLRPFQELAGRARGAVALHEARRGLLFLLVLRRPLAPRYRHAQPPLLGFGAS